MIMFLSQRMVQTVTAPRDVAVWLMGLNLSKPVLQTLFGAVVAVNALLLAVQMMISGGSAQVLGLGISPFGLAGVLALSLLATIVAFTFVGRWAGGSGSLADMAVLMIWLQALRVAVQVAFLILTPLGTSILALLGLLASAMGVYILVNFLMVGHRFDSVFKAILVLIFAVLGIAVLMSMAFGALGLNPMGVPSNV